MAENILFPVGRLVEGDLYKGSDKNQDGTPRVYKTGANAGQPRVEFFFAVAVPKTQQGFRDEPWGQIMNRVATTAFPNGQTMRPDFAWKVIDGDSQIPNKANKIPRNQEGYAGHWVIRFSGSFAPKLYTLMGVAQPTPLAEPNAINLGDYVEVFGNIDPNTGQTPGIYVNHSMVCLRGYGQRIVKGPDVTEAGFGAAALPAGASMVPVGASAMPLPVPGAAAAPSLPPLPSAPVPLPTLPPLSAAPAPLPVVPAPHLLGIQPPPAPPAPAHVMTPAAGGVTYEQYKSAGWSDDQLRQNGLML